MKVRKQHITPNKHLLHPITLKEHLSELVPTVDGIGGWFGHHEGAFYEVVVAAEIGEHEVGAVLQQGVVLDYVALVGGAVVVLEEVDLVVGEVYGV